MNKPLHEISEIEHFYIPLPDGTRLSARMWTPVDADKNPVPAVLEYIPYRKNDGTLMRDALRQPIIARQGYAAVRVDLRGTGESDGIIHDEYTAQELQDGCDVIAWLAAQPWCNGNVGMTGKSWGGFNCLQIAALRPPALKAVLAVAFTDNRYTDDVHYLGGCVSASEMLSWSSIMLADLATPPEPRLVGERWREMWLERLEAQTPWVETWLEHQTFDDYWQHGSICVDYDAIEVPVYAVCGLSDGYANSVLRVLENLKGVRKGLLGPWGHVYPTQGYPEPAIDFLSEAVRWWDRWLKEEPNGIEDEPMLTTWMLDSVPPRPGYDERLGRWVADKRWPAESVEYVDYAVFKDGPNDQERFWTGEIATPQTHGAKGGQWWGYGKTGQLPDDQQETDAEALSFTSDMLEHPVDILGFPEVSLRLSSDKPQGFIVARLCDVRPDGSSVLISYGVHNLTHKNGHERVVPLTPGEPIDLFMRLNLCAYSLPAGHRLRLSLSNSYWPLVWPSPEPSTLSLYRYDCDLSLPLRMPQYHDGEFLKKEPFGPARLAEPFPHTVLREPVHSRDWSIDLLGRLFYVRTDDEGSIMYTDVEAGPGLVIETKGVETYSILPDDPLSARVEITHLEERWRGTWQISIRTLSRMSCDADFFYLENRLEVLENGRVVFDRSWEKKVRR